jgi:type VI secretion system VgrG family protein
VITLEMAAVAAGMATPVPVRAEAEESVSGCFAVTVDVLAGGALDPAVLLNTAATLTFGEVPLARRFAGLVTGLAAQGAISGGQLWYRLRIEPGLRLLALTRRSRVFCTEQAATVPGVLRQVLASGIDVAAQGTMENLGYAAYPLRDMVVQYEESDLAFFARLAEHSGVFWLLDPETPGAPVLLGDSNLAFPMLRAGSAGAALRFRPSLGLADTAPAIRGAQLNTTLAPKGATVDEWSYGKPAMTLAASSALLPGQVGLQQSWGADNYDSAAWGTELASIRSQEAAVDRAVLTGQSNVPPLGAGRVFSMTGHDVAPLDGQYVATSVRHRGWQSVAGAEYLPGDVPPGTGYGNEFHAIPFAVPFRPARRTPTPRIPGLIRAVIDATEMAASSNAATIRSQVDAAGFYRVVLPFDTARHAPGKASCAVRLLSVYGGPAEGLHFPLRPGTQVMLAFHNGDPDRPVIVGAVPDHTQASVVTTENRTVNTLRTASGITVRFSDGQPSA